jgi:hypothetical protein
VKTGLAIAALASAVFAASALATATQADYVAQVNPICKNAAPAVKRIPSRIKKTGNPFIDSLQESVLYGRLLAKTLDKIERVPPAPGEEAAVQSWLTDGHLEVRYIKGLFRAFIHGKPKRAKVMIKRIVKAQTRASAKAAALGLTACSRTKAQGVS